jgi:hypothetical protein
MERSGKKVYLYIDFLRTPGLSKFNSYAVMSGDWIDWTGRHLSLDISPHKLPRDASRRWLRRKRVRGCLTRIRRVNTAIQYGRTRLLSIKLGCTDRWQLVKPVPVVWWKEKAFTWALIFTRAWAIHLRTHMSDWPIVVPTWPSPTYLGLPPRICPLATSSPASATPCPYLYSSRTRNGRLPPANAAGLQ